MEDETGELRDYKFFCFNGEVAAVMVATNRFNKEKEAGFDYLDTDFNKYDFVKGHKNSEILPEKPKTFEEMKKYAKMLSVGIPHVRVDFYNVNGEIFFGELTFFDGGGFEKFEPESWDKVFGGWLKLPSKL